MSRPSPRLTLGLCMIALGLIALNLWGWSEISRRELYRDRARVHSEEADEIDAEIEALAESRASAEHARKYREWQLKTNEPDAETAESLGAELRKIRSEIDRIESATATLVSRRVESDKARGVYLKKLQTPRTTPGPSLDAGLREIAPRFDRRPASQRDGRM